MDSNWVVWGTICLTLLVVFLRFFAWLLGSIIRICLRISTRILGISKPQATEPNITGNQKYDVDIVGESNYQPVLAAICGKRTAQSVKKIVTASLVHEDENPHDQNAVRVDIEGKTVGYLDRENAKKYRKLLAKAGQPGATTTCQAIIVGGWDDGNGRTGFFGVKLDLG